jgi:general secretion pathway protein I
MMSNSDFRARETRGFTLLEVLVAVAILGLGLTVILSSQVGLFAGVTRSRNLGFAANLTRCRMSELELELLKDGYPLIDQAEEGPCCEDERDPRFSCEWKVELVELPEPPISAEEDVLEMLGGGDEKSGPLGALQELQTNGAAALSGDGLSGLTGLFGQQGNVGVDGFASMAMTWVYPELKPMLEASIRKLTVIVHWNEGRRPEELSVVEYVTNPMQGELDTDAIEVPDTTASGPLSGSGASASPDTQPAKRSGSRTAPRGK